MTTDRRAARRTQRPAAKPVSVDPYAWLTSATDADLTAWLRDVSPLPADEYRRLPIVVRLRLAKLEDPEGMVWS